MRFAIIHLNFSLVVSASRIILLALFVASLHHFNVRCYSHTAAESSLRDTYLGLPAEKHTSIAAPEADGAQASASMCDLLLPQYDDEESFPVSIQASVPLVFPPSSCIPLCTSECLRQSLHRLAAHYNWDYLTLGVLIT